MKFIFGEGFQRTLGGSMMVAGTAIGAGMLALPMTSAGMWFNWSMVLMLLSWFCMLRASQAILEVNLLFEPGDSLHTLVQNTLGSFWSVLNGFSVAFVLYTLVYAYVSSGGSVVQHALQSSWGITPPRVLTSLIFTILLTACVWWSSKAVDRLSAILMGGMVITFLLSIGGMIGQARLDSMLGLDGQSGEFIFIFGAASTYLTSFCFHASVPSLIKYLGKDARTINSCLRIGTVIALLCYVVWIAAADGIIPRDDFKHITNVGDLVAASGTSLGGIIVKGLSLQPRDGNPCPRIVETTAGMLNAVGLQNDGVEAFCKEKLPRLPWQQLPVIANLYATSPAEFGELAARLNEEEGVAALEVNVSCPNVKSGGILFGQDPKLAAAVTRAARDAAPNKPLIIKLSPNVTDIALMARSVQDAGADMISCINTLSGMAVDVARRKPRLANVIGGLSGPAIKPVALRCVWQVCKAVDIPVIGLGGICSAEDVLEFILVGAHAVQIGTANFISPDRAFEIVKELPAVCRQLGVTSLDELRGSLKTA